MHKRLIIFLLAFAPLAASGQSMFLQPYSGYIDSALRALNMDRGDLSLSWEQYQALSLIEDCAAKPLTTFDEVDSEARFLATASAKALIYFFDNKHAFQRPSDYIYFPKGINYTKELRDGLVKSWPSASKQLQELIIALMLNTEAGHHDMVVTGANREYLEKHYNDLQRFSEAEDKKQAPCEMKKRQDELMESIKKFTRLAEASYYQAIIKRGLENYAILVEIADALRTESPPAQCMTIKSKQGKIYYGDDPPEDATLIILSKASSHIHLTPVIGRPRFIIDLGGDDVYEGDSFSLGAALFGTNILIDMGGNDTYRSNNYDQGTACFGLGIINDLSGNDHYISNSFSQGFAAYGVGLIIDEAGSDIYEGAHYVQAVGMTGGYGAIIDKGGNDNYIIRDETVDIARYTDHFESVGQGMGIGFRPLAPGGIGMLVDVKGNDNYTCDIFGQGSAYWMGLGALVDMEGNDHYSAYQYAQGSASHYGLGILIDMKGNDAYKSHGVSQACGHDNSFGGLFDKEGDDTYTLNSLGQGAGNANSSSIFIDASGNDGYLATSSTHGYSDTRFGFGMPSLFLDLSGRDIYSTTTGNNSSSSHGLYGSFMDASMGGTAENISENHGPADSLIRATIAHDVQGLFCQAAASSVAYNYLFTAAIDSLAKRPEALPYLMSMLGTELPREALVLQTITSRFGEAAVPYLRDSIFYADDKTSTRSFNLLNDLISKGYGKSAEAILIKAAHSPEARYRAKAYDALGRYNDSGIVQVLLPGMKESYLPARRSATEAIAHCGRFSDLNYIIDMLDDSSQQVRNAVTPMIKRFGVPAADLLLRKVILAANHSDRARLQALISLVEVKGMGEKQLNSILPLLQNDWRYQLRVIEVIKASGNRNMKEKLRKELVHPQSSFVKKKLEEL